MRRAALAAVVAGVGVSAHEEYVARNPNGANVPGVAAIGHINPGGGGAANAYGAAFSQAGLQWSAALCALDSDGDGLSNGLELGDPCCTWTVGTQPQFGNDISNPGDAASKTQRGMVNCSSPPPGSPSPSPAPASGTGADYTIVWASLGAAAAGLFVGVAATCFTMNGRKRVGKGRKAREGSGGEDDAYDALQA